MSEFGQGLTLSGIGILITFSALGILIVLILLLRILFPEKVDPLDDSKPHQKLSSGAEMARNELRKKAAAAGVAVLLSRLSSIEGGSLGSELEKPVGKWWQQGVDRIHNKE